MACRFQIPANGLYIYVYFEGRYTQTNRKPSDESRVFIDVFNEVFKYMRELRDGSGKPHLALVECRTALINGGVVYPHHGGCVVHDFPNAGFSSLGTNSWYLVRDEDVGPIRTPLFLKNESLR